MTNMEARELFDRVKAADQEEQILMLKAISDDELIINEFLRRHNIIKDRLDNVIGVIGGKV